jgi:hypothetical protein
MVWQVVKFWTFKVKTMSKYFSLSVKVCVLMLFAISLPFVVSCKKSSPPLPPSSSGQQVTDVNRVSMRPPKPSVQAPDVAKSDANRPAKTALQTSDANTSDANHPAGPSTSSGQGWVPIEIKLPRAVFEGTPQDRRVSNLEKPTGKARPLFYAPAGTKNVALGKPVLSSDEEPIIGEVKMITDGDKEAADGSYVELGPLLQHVTIDLQAVYEIYAIVLWHYHKQPQVYYDVIVQVATDPNFEVRAIREPPLPSVRTLFNNDIDNSAGLGVGKDMHYTETHEGKLIDARGARVRYVRLYSNGNNGSDLNHYIEVEVYGKPVE